MGKRTQLAKAEQGRSDLTPGKVAEAMLRELRHLSDPKKAASTQRFFKEPVQALGIDTPTLRRIARVWTNRLKGVWRLRQAVALCDELLRHPQLEVRGAGFLVLGAFREEFDEALFHRAERWVRRYLDNWASVDGFVLTVFSPLLEQHPELAGRLPQWRQTPCMWVRRAALVALVPFARRGEQLDLAYRLVAASLGEKADLMHKALGWLLREAGRTDAARLKSFLLQHRQAIPRTTVRYAIEHFPLSARQDLLKLTRGPLADRSTKRRSVAWIA